LGHDSVDQEVTMNDRLEAQLLNEEARQLAELVMQLGRGEINLAQVLGLDTAILAQLALRSIGLIQWGKLDEAEDLLAKLTRVDVRSLHLPFLLGACRAKAGDMSGAVDAYNEALRRTGYGDPDSVSQHILFNRAEALIAIGETDHAMADLRAASEGPDEKIVVASRRCLYVREQPLTVKE
jgi:tetratricopeptide (TPR) repeat protein